MVKPTPQGWGEQVRGGGKVQGAGASGALWYLLYLLFPQYLLRNYPPLS